MSPPLQLKYRPRTLDQVRGQAGVVAALKQAVKRDAVPHAALFCGPPGTGKTSISRIVAGIVGAVSSDVVEINAAEKRTLDDVRSLLARCSQRPSHPKSKSRVYILDEAHQLTKKQGGDAQTALLKKLEEPPPDCYFFLCSSEPQHLLPAIRSRCTTYQTKGILIGEQKKLILEVAKQEGIKLTDRVVGRLCEVAQGSGRDALKLLDQIAGLKDEEERCDFLDRADAQTEGINLCRLLNNPNTQWSEMSECLKGLEAEPETIRRQILGYFGYVALSGGKSVPRAVAILSVFRDNYFDSGKAGLIADCFEVCQLSRRK